MTTPLSTGRHRAPRTTAHTRALRTGVALVVSAGFATVAAMPANANAGGLEDTPSTFSSSEASVESTTTASTSTQQTASTSPRTSTAAFQERSNASASRSTERENVASTSGSAVLDYAEQNTGIMYQWGGSTPAGFDCSGYTQFAFAQAGIDIPRTTEAQRMASTPVSTPQPGDLVFYGAPAYHVAIYAGDGMIYDSGRAGLPTQKRAMFSGVTGFGRVG